MVFWVRSFFVKYGNDLGGVAHHPFVPELKAGTAVPHADVPDRIARVQRFPVLLLPFPAPTCVKAVIGTGADRPDPVPLPGVVFPVYIMPHAYCRFNS